MGNKNFNINNTKAFSHPKLFTLTLSVLAASLLLVGFNSASAIPGIAGTNDGENTNEEDLASPLNHYSQAIHVGTVDCNVDSNVVGWVTNNGGSAVQSKEMVEDIESELGKTVREVHLEGSIPECIQVLIVNSLGDNACTGNTPIGAANEAAIIDWVENNGGSVYILDELSGCGGNTANLTAHWGAARQNACVSGTYNSSDFDENHPIFEGVDSMALYCGSTYVTDDTLETVLFRGSPLMLAGQAGEGCVVISNDSNWVNYQFINNFDNRLVVQNTMAYLSECSKILTGGPAPEPEGPFCKEYDFNVEQIENDNIEIFTFGGFNGAGDWSGAGDIESVQGYSQYGFDGQFLRNFNGGNPALKTTLTLTNLPPHNSVDIGFLLATIDSWDSNNENQYAPDYFNVDVDGTNILQTTHNNAGGDIDYKDVNPDALLVYREHIDWWNSYPESGYDMNKESALKGIVHTSDTLTIDFYASGSGWQGGNDESWAIENVAVGLDNGCQPPAPEPEVNNNGGDNQWDTRPTFGVSHETRQGLLVENGFSFNGDYFTITDNHHTDFERQYVEVGTMNSFSATVYADKKLKVQEFLFGIPNVGEAHLAELGVEVWYDRDGNIEDVRIMQETDVIDEGTISVSSEMTKCLSTDVTPLCNTTTVAMTFLEPLMHDVMALKAIDWANRDQRTYLNDGFDISGDSLNPMQTQMIPSNIKNQGLIKVTQLAKYSPYWQSADGRMFEMNSFGSFKEINQSFERFADTGDARTRLHSGFGGILQYEQNRATQVFDSTKIISDLPDSFGYHFEITERLNEDMMQKIYEQQEIAKEILKEMDKQNRYY